MEKTNPLHPFSYDSSRYENDNALSQTPRDRKTRDENAGGTQFHTRGSTQLQSEVEVEHGSRKRQLNQDFGERFKRRNFDGIPSSSALSSEANILTSDDPLPIQSMKNLNKVSSGPGSYLSSESVYYFHNRVPSSPPAFESQLHSSPQRNVDDNDVQFFTSQATVIPQSSDNDENDNDVGVGLDDNYLSNDSDDTIDFNVDLFNRVNPYYNSDYLHEEFGTTRDSYDDHLLIDKVRNLIADNIFEGNPQMHLESYGLTRLPDEIGDLNNMTVLGRNGIEVPKVEIYASRNLLRILPPALFKIKNLTVLSLRGNKLKRLPGIIQNLENLVELIIVTNELRVLPHQILKLPKLSSLLVRPNPHLIELKDQDPSSYFCVSDKDPKSEVDVKRYVSKVKWIDNSSSPYSHPDLDKLSDREVLQTISPVPKLTELVLRRISGYQVTRSETIKWKKNIPTYMQRMITKALQKGIFEETCSTCDQICVNPVAKSLEWWDLKTESLVPIRRNFCCGNCVKSWLDEVEVEKQRYNGVESDTKMEMDTTATTTQTAETSNDTHELSFNDDF